MSCLMWPSRNVGRIWSLSQVVRLVAPKSKFRWVVTGHTYRLVEGARDNERIVSANGRHRDAVYYRVPVPVREYCQTDYLSLPQAPRQ